jgi:hypothetical protein
MADQKKTRRPEDNEFQQQRLKSWQPLLTPFWVIVIFFVVGLAFIPIGAVILNASNQVVQTSARYDTRCKGQTTCRVPVEITADMDSPIYFYYELRNFYQNHRRYVKSRADAQLRGESVLSDLSSCDPLEKYHDTPLYPCGIIANSYFNDTFLADICSTSGACQNLIVNATWFEWDIAWESDIEKKFALPNDVSQYDANRYGPGGFQLPLVTDEHFIVWMRTAGLPTFKKLYARIEDTKLTKGQTVFVNISNNFPVDEFDGEKHIVFSTTSWLGGKNNFLGIAYIAMGALCWFLALIFLIKHRVSPRKLGDMRYFNWRKLPIEQQSAAAAAVAAASRRDVTAATS